MMPKTSDGKIALLALIAMAAWLLIALPIIYAPSAFDLRKWLTHDAAGFFTSLLVIVGALQLALFIWQLRLIRASLDGAQIASDAAAVAAKAASRQAHIAEETLAKIERPYLFVFNVSSVKVETWEDIEGDGSRLAVTYSVANYGKIPAIIQWLQVSFSVFTKPLDPANADFNHPLVVSPILASGETRPEIYEGLEWSDFGNDEFNNLVPDFGKGNDLFLWIIVRYRGPFSSGHETRACWRYVERTGRFVEFNGGSEHNREA